MPDHDVRLSLSNLEVRSIDYEFKVTVDGVVLGTLGVSEGGLKWRAKNKQMRHGVDITWGEFAEWAES